jgi:hypothetical protein
MRRDALVEKLPELGLAHLATGPGRTEEQLGADKSLPVESFLDGQSLGARAVGHARTLHHGARQPLGGRTTSQRKEEREGHPGDAIHFHGDGFLSRGSQVPTVMFTTNLCVRAQEVRRAA